MARLTIGEVARQAGIRPSAIRYYEEIGVLPSPERVGGQRRYDNDVLTRLGVVRMAQEAGFTIEEVRQLLSGFPEGTPASERWRELAQRKLPEVDARIVRLQAVRAVLEESLRCGCLTLDACAALGWGNQPPGPEGGRPDSRRVGSHAERSDETASLATLEPLLHVP
ncbi:MAG: MerR family transcriptional regulator [Chloroflexota bacterium]|nr:MerR family transcriptional regulator [Chloroflexota bacterium]